MEIIKNFDLFLFISSINISINEIKSFINLIEIDFRFKSIEQLHFELIYKFFLICNHQGTRS